ncbi:MAG: hypothetical protein ACYTFA_17400 [Planctomycetota bacterium]
MVICIRATRALRFATAHERGYRLSNTIFDAGDNGYAQAATSLAADKTFGGQPRQAHDLPR